ncbi:29547_t:CDS:2, partial [Gigaspora margarita]
ALVQNLFSLFKFYETTFGNITFNWIESHSMSAKLTKSPTSSEIVKFDAKVAGSLSSTIIDHIIGDIKKSLHSDILNLVALLLEHLDVSVKVATNIKVFSLQVIGRCRSKYKAVLYLTAVFHDEFIKQLAIMQELDLNINHSERVTIRDVLKIPKSLQDILEENESKHLKHNKEEKERRDTFT